VNTVLHALHDVHPIAFFSEHVRPVLFAVAVTAFFPAVFIAVYLLWVGLSIGLGFLL